MENGVLIVGIFVSAGVLSYGVIPGLLIMWDRVLDRKGEDRRRAGGVITLPPPCRLSSDFVIEVFYRA